MEHWTNECHLAYLRIRLTKRKIHMLSTVDKQDKATSSIDAEKKQRQVMTCACAACLQNNVLFATKSKRYSNPLLSHKFRADIL